MPPCGTVPPFVFLARLAAISSVRQFHHFDLANRDLAARIVVLEGEITILPFLLEVQIVIKFVVVDDHSHVRDRPAAPIVVAHFDFVFEPRVGLDQLLVDVALAVQRAGADRVGVCAVDLCFVAIGEARLRRRAAEIEPRIAVVADLAFRPIAEILVRLTSCRPASRPGPIRSSPRPSLPTTLPSLADLFPAIQVLPSNSETHLSSALAWQARCEANRATVASASK